MSDNVVGDDRDRTTSETRRSALHRFGRYAAAAPGTIYLLSAGTGAAAPGRGQGYGAGGRFGRGGPKRNGSYTDG